VVFIHATVCDAQGNPVYGSDANVTFQLEGNGKLIGSNPMKAEAGIASILLQAGNEEGTLTVKATGANLKTAVLKVMAER